MAPIGTVLFNVNLYDPIAKTSEVTNVVSVGADLLDGKLEAIRETLYKEGAIESNKLNLAFCTPTGAQLADSISYSQYRKLIAQKDEIETTQHNVFFREQPSKKKEPTPLGENVRDLLQKKPDLELSSKPELLKATINDLSSAYTHADYRADAGSGKAKNPANMTQEDWTTVLHHTNFLSGHRLVFAMESADRSRFQRMERAPYQGFHLKCRYYEPLDVARNRNVNALYWVEIPLFVVEDESYVEVFETASDVSNSMARSSFSKTDIQASAGGGAFGYSVGVSAGFSRSESNALSSSTQSTGRTINITYNFPRVVLHLEADSLVMTKQLMDEIEHVRKHKTEDALLRLHHKFGHFFATRVELGGRLHSSEELEAFGKATAAEAASAMKASASASFSGPSVQASASYSKEEQQKSSSASSISQLQRSITWQAQGGDTLLCNNPPKWCATVAPFDNWRVIKQDDVVPLGQLISQFEGYGDIPQLFSGIAGLTRRRETVSFRLHVESENQRGKYLAVAMNIGNIGAGIQGELGRKYDSHAYEQQLKAICETAEYKDVMHRTDQFRMGAQLTGLDDYSIFEVEVDTFLGQPANICYGTLLRLKNRKTQRYLSATQEIHQLPDRLFLFPGEKDRDATDFVIAKPGNPSCHAPIKDNDLVELRVFNKAGESKGFVSICSAGTLASKPWSDEYKNDVLFFKFQLQRDLNVLKPTSG